MWPDGSCSSMRPMNKEQKGHRRPEILLRTLTHVGKKKKNHLFDVEDKEVFNSADGRQHRAVERADPADGLTVDDL